ncbi:uncharacterized protein LOC129591820 [Paramacrobiotus metropolitanus]|uniref:uncharacterized protein LOC129591820 n=1 Tax=Paramacrobiotus metropolitanus TaxID=2943436 RepID=UPI0024459871|nr:uncharacterized protein LOC129591820 [Paramacrobiotus metropolitanus]
MAALDDSRVVKFILLFSVLSSLSVLCRGQCPQVACIRCINPGEPNPAAANGCPGCPLCPTGAGDPRAGTGACMCPAMVQPCASALPPQLILNNAVGLSPLLPTCCPRPVCG